ncbi:MAG TPA: PHP domain-containing protein [Gemmatimonadota bacterium]|nr:PHP domain-containing protein [Gemmatimonadota bacterium]
MPIDLHSHTTVSDGALSPAELVILARDRGLSVLAITDHDATDAIETARRAAPSGLEILAGAELTVHVANREAHILAYGIDHQAPALRAALAELALRREERAREIVNRLVGLGIEVAFTDVLAASGGGTIARPHVARALVDRGHASSLDEAFRRWLGRHGPAFVPKQALPPRVAFDLVKAAGGVSALAHPGTFRRDDLIPVLVEAGLEGLEVRHTEHSAARTRHYEALARDLALLPTGGSDFHGTPGHRSRLGVPVVPDAWAEALVARIHTPR